jgi:hypothetical protein
MKYLARLCSMQLIPAKLLILRATNLCKQGVTGSIPVTSTTFLFCFCRLRCLVGESENYGDEQEHLNNVFGARLRITSLHAPAGPGVELLEYLAPRDGRMAPSGSQTDDLWAWETTVSSANTADADHSLHSAKVDFVSSGIATVPDSTLGFARGFLVRDPDSHLVRVVQP